MAIKIVKISVNWRVVFKCEKFIVFEEIKTNESVNLNKRNILVNKLKIEEI